ncbi:MAG: hypothetical protein HQL64_09540 [Magnetococcales bacterium]|nr:hypothetical protein [Magnetococcales bacterium]
MILALLAGSSSALDVILMVLRINGAISLDVPLQLATSGCEEESLYALWKYHIGEPVFGDPTRIPFAASYFNWLFYVIYGEIGSLAQKILGFGELWFPTVWHLITLFGVIFGTVVLARTLFKVVRGDDGIPHGAAGVVLAWAFSVLVFLGPLVGFWGITARPDALAMVFEACAMAAFFAMWPRTQAGAVIVYAFFAFCAWSMKQINIVAFGAMGLLLLVRGRYRLLFLLVGLASVLCGVVLALGSDSYRNILFLRDTHIELFPSLALFNLLQLLRKAPPILVGVAALSVCLINPALRARLLASDAFILGSSGMVVWAMVMIPASAKLGAADNYHFVALLYGALALVAALGCVGDRCRALSVGLLLGWFLALASVSLALAGGARISLAEDGKENDLLKSCMADLQKPLYIPHLYATLPWMSGSIPVFQLAYHYWGDRARGRTFERGGVGGLIEEGYFGSLLLETSTGESYDQGRLDTFYRRTNRHCGRFVLYERRYPGVTP